MGQVTDGVSAWHPLPKILLFSYLVQTKKKTNTFEVYTWSTFWCITVLVALVIISDDLKSLSRK